MEGLAIILARLIVPTPVGVNRKRNQPYKEEDNCPHTRGGEPDYRRRKRVYSTLSPHPWG